MRSVSAALRSAIDSGERIIDSTFTVDWDNDGIQDIDNLSYKVDTLAVSQSLESSLPQQVQMVPGVAVAELTAKIGRGNTTRYAIPAFVRQVGTTSFAGTSAQWSIARPANAKTGDVVMIAIFVALPGFGSSMSSWQPLIRSNVTWLPMSLRGDGGIGNTRLEGLLLQRRVADNEPATYTIDLPAPKTLVYASAAVVVGDQNIMGITDFVQKGEDNVTTATSINLPPVKVDVPNSTIVTFCAAASYAITGTAFTPLGGDTEQAEIVANGSAQAQPSIRMGVMTAENVAQGIYSKGVTITGGVGTSAIATIGFSVTLTPRLAGDEAQHAAWTFSELNADSPYAGKTRIRRKTQWLLRFITENGREEVPIFTGYTTAPSGSSDRTTTIKALDRREDMRNTNQGLNIAAVYPTSLDSASGSSLPTYPGLEATWMVSRLFFLAFWRTRPSTLGIFTYDSVFPTASGLGFFPSPLAHRTTAIWAPMHGSAHALTGYIQYAYTTTAHISILKRVAFEIGPFVAATKNEGQGSQTNISWQLNNSWFWLDSGTGQFVGRAQMWVRRVYSTSTMQLRFADNNGAVYDAWIEILSTGVVRLRVEFPGGVSRTITGPTVSADSTWHFLGVSWDSVAGSVKFRLDSVTTTVAMTTWANSVVTFVIATANLTLVDGLQISELQIAGGYDVNSGRNGIQLTDAFANENFTPTAFIDKSENVLDVLPLIDINADGFSIVSDIANAEFAAFFFDEDGYPHYRTSRSDASDVGQTIQKMVTSRRSIADIGYESGVLQIRNIISVGYTPFALNRDTEIFSASGIIAIGVGQSVEFTVSVPGPIISNVWNTPFTAYSNPDGTGANLTTQVGLQIISDVAGQVTIRIDNASGSTMYLVDNTGQPNFHVRATFFAPLNGSFAPVTYVDTDSIREFNEQTLSVSASPWVQTSDIAASIALKLLSDLCVSRPVITSLTIKGDPTLQFGDLVTVVDKNGLGVNGRYRITGRDPSFSPAEGFSQSLVVRGAPTIAYWDTNFWDDGTVWG